MFRGELSWASGGVGALPRSREHFRGWEGRGFVGELSWAIRASGHSPTHPRIILGAGGWALDGNLSWASGHSPTQSRNIFGVGGRGGVWRKTFLGEWASGHSPAQSRNILGIWGVREKPPHMGNCASGHPPETFPGSGVWFRRAHPLKYISTAWEGDSPA